MLLGIQIVGILFGLCMVYYSYLTYKKNEFNKSEFLVWALIWILFIFMTILPSSLEPIVKTMSLKRSFDLLVICGFIFLTTLAYYNYLLIKKMRKKMEILVRKVTLSKSDYEEK